jgi:Flp pilus assembly protein TadD
MSETETNPDKLYDAANQLKEDGDLEGCVSALLGVLKTTPDHQQTHMALGVHLQKLGRPDEAITHAKRVVELNSDDAFSYTQLSVIYQRCGKITEAEDAMARAREIQMQSGQGHHH